MPVRIATISKSVGTTGRFAIGIRGTLGIGMGGGFDRNTQDTLPDPDATSVGGQWRRVLPPAFCPGARSILCYVLANLFGHFDQQTRITDLLLEYVTQ